MTKVKITLAEHIFGKFASNVNANCVGSHSELFRYSVIFLSYPSTLGATTCSAILIYKT